MGRAKASAPVGLPAGSRRKANGFTLVELLVIMAIISILLSMMGPALKRALYMTEMDICYSNVHQLSTAWTAFQADNRGYLVNGSTHGADPWAKWGNEAPSNADRYQLIATGALWPYTKQYQIYLCPSDPVEHIRSYSIQTMMNGFDWGSLPYVTRYGTISDPTGQLVFIEEKDRRSVSNMGTFAQDPLCWGKNRWVDYVANFHDDGDNLGFSDGHAEHWEWTDPRTLTASANNQFYYPDNGNPDLHRLRKHMFNEMPGAY